MGISTALNINDLSFRYGHRQALDKVAVSVKPAETVVLLGPNGAGKTTLFSIISGLFATQSGNVSIAGLDLEQQGAQALAPLGIVFQAQTLDLDLTVKQNLLYFCALHGIDKHAARDRIELALKRLDMEERINDKVRTLNGGHRRRVEIARATLHKPDILLLDEPTVGLDIPTRRALIDHLHELPKASGTAMLWATHFVDEVKPDDRVIIMHKGRIVADAVPAILIEQTNTDSLEYAFNKLTNASAENIQSPGQHA